ncbi:MAG: hypothetical protein ABIF77_03595 [bacterium]
MLFLYAGDGVTQLDMNDDGGVGYYILTYGHDGVSCDHAISAESQSWGAVKALYG